MNQRLQPRQLAASACLALVPLILLGCAPTLRISGQVLDAATNRPLPNSLVSLRASAYSTTSDDQGRFILRLPAFAEELEITAWRQGYYIASALVAPTETEVVLALRQLHPDDHPDYRWIDPFPEAGEDLACGACHSMIMPQWRENAHGAAFDNPRFFSFYQGTNLQGTLQVAPGYQLDFPATAGSCSACHLPGAAVDAPFNTNASEQRGQVTSGIHCDFCHKISDVFLDPATAAPYPNMPGIFSYQLLRPPSGDQIFFGPYADIKDPDTFLPLISESAFCAPCHQFSFWGTSIYNSYGEWLESAYAEEGVTCQDCHMPPNGDHFFADEPAGGLWHPAEQIPSHLDLGLRDADFMRSTMTMLVATEISGQRLEVSVELENQRGGHHVPTDHPGRNLLLVVEAFDENGQALPLLTGTQIAEWGGDLAGKPGIGFAKILRDLRSGEAPVVSYWRPSVIEQDNRIPARAQVSQTFGFQAPAQSAEVEVRLVFRRLFQPIAQRYGWPNEDLVLNSWRGTVVIEGGEQ